MTLFRSVIVGGLMVALVAGLGLQSVSSRPAAASEPPATAGDPEAPKTVVVELFTSQGCSSCPPADRLLSELRESGEAAGVEIVPLSFHVDYWNYIGWTDPFSSAAWSERQRLYGEALGLNTIYTPQTIFDGHLECVGSSRSKVTRLLAEAATQDDIRVDLTVANGEAGPEARVTVDGADSSRELLVYLAIWEDGLVTPVGRGENARKTLENDAVVRRFDRLGEIGQGAAEWRQPLRLDSDWDRGNLGVAIVVQDPITLRIHGSAAVQATDFETAI